MRGQKFNKEINGVSFICLTKKLLEFIIRKLLPKVRVINFLVSYMYCIVIFRGPSKTKQNKNRQMLEQSRTNYTHYQKYPFLNVYLNLVCFVFATPSNKIITSMKVQTININNHIATAYI